MCFLIDAESTLDIIKELIILETFGQFQIELAINFCLWLQKDGNTGTILRLKVLF